MKKEKKVWAMTLIALWWLAPNLTHAQQDSLRSYNLDEVVVVTATKFPKSLAETGKVLTIIDSVQLERNRGKDLAQLLNEQVGLVVSGANTNAGKDKSIFLRGATAGYTLVLLDGIPLNDPSSPSGGAFDLRLLSIDQVERIEILKGNQSTLYGSDAIAGVINIITKKGGDKPVGVSSMLSYGSYNTFKGNVALIGTMEQIDYNIGYTFFKTEGISEAKEPENNIIPFDNDGMIQRAFQANLGFYPVSSLRINPFFRYTNFSGDYDGGSYTDNPLSRYKSNLLNYGMTAQYELGSKMNINGMYSFERTIRKYATTFEGSFNYADLFVQYDASEKIQLVGGLNYQYLGMQDNGTDTTATMISPYLSFFIRNVNGFSFEAGARYNHHSAYGNNSTFSLNPSYWINRNTKVFYNLSSGFKVPTLSQLYGPFGANPNLMPEKSLGHEAGVQLMIMNKADVRVVLFTRQINDVIHYNGQVGYINLNEQNDKGLEVEPTWQINDAFSVKAYYAFVTGEVSTTVSERDTTYFNLIRRPKHTIGINIGYQLTKNLFVSSMIKTFSKRTDTYFDMTDFMSKPVVLDRYVLWDVHADYQLMRSRLKIFLDVRNILNQDYEEVYGYSTFGVNVTTGVAFKW